MFAAHRWLVLTFIFFSLTAASQDDARLSELDQYARSVPGQYSHSIDTLVSYLIIPAQNDNEKARLIYAWIAQNLRYDDRAINSNKTSDFSVSTVLKKKKAVCMGYASLFEAMGTEAGLNVRTIIGYSKDSKRGKKLKNPDHVWNVVENDGRWMLCDATWGSGYAEPKRNGKTKTVKRYNPFWFDTRPDAFALTHLPDISRWQLMSVPVTKKQFEDFPFIHSGFFEVGFTVDTIFQKLLKTPKYEVPVVYQTRHSWQIINAPANGGLLKENTVNIAIRSEVYDKLIVVNGDNETTIIDFDLKVASVVVKPKGKRLTVYVIDDKRPRKAEGILAYKVLR